MRAATRAAERAAPALALIALALSASDAAAHGEGNANVRPLLDPPPPALAGMRVELHQTIAPQVVLANPTARIVEVLDPGGAAFLRIGPQGVEGNVAARAWYETYSPGAPVPKDAGRGEARWLRVQKEPSFGWFDPRLDASAVQVPHRVIDAAKPADVGRWRIALRVDGKPVALGGRFAFVPPPRGRWVARLTSPSEVAPGVRMTLLPGRSPGLLLENAGKEAVTVLGDGGEPFLRIGPQGVEADVHSTTWRRSGRAAAAPAASPQPGATSDWQRVATVPRFGWLDPRTAFADDTIAPTDPAEKRPFRVPLLLGERRLDVTGEFAWHAFDPSAAPQATPPAAH